MILHYVRLHRYLCRRYLFHPLYHLPAVWTK